MPTDLAQKAAALLGERALSAERLAGGGLSEVLALRLTSGAEVVAKGGPAPRVEAAMLGALDEAGAPAPAVLAVSDEILVLEKLPERGALGPVSWGELGAILRALHQRQGPHYGWNEDYAFGAVAIRNAPSRDWPMFWAEQRLLAEAERLPPLLARRLETLAERLPEMLPQRPPASLCHGDLWTGNVVVNQRVVSGLIDPAACYAHSETDLAMLSLFGTPDDPFWDSYGEPEPGWRERRAVYQLWPAIVHLRLFGRGYRGLVETLLEALGV